MQIRRLFLLYFSPTGHARRVARMLAGGLRASGLPIDEIDVTDKWDREEPREFDPGDLVFTAFPVYFGRLPLPLQTLDCWSGNGAFAVPVAAYGNDDFRTFFAKFFGYFFCVAGCLSDVKFISDVKFVQSFFELFARFKGFSFSRLFANDEIYHPYRP